MGNDIRKHHEKISDLNPFKSQIKKFHKNSCTFQLLNQNKNNINPQFNL